ncbi:MAG: NAD(P)-dependent dehydrogenase (short-subunit alcohol dehydrogenase family) [Woeseiaceae bacterium]|jgi:NAD(P)-dependent dehydrogenase (short-subunit alcohol dehydrogenase family)
MKQNAIAIMALACLLLSVAPTYAQNQEQKAILVTGATTGIGRNLAETLAAEGHFVYAGARKQSDMDELNSIDNVMAVRLDVTKQGDIDAAVELITNEGRGLYGLVNNAGVAVVAPMIEVSEDDMQFQMNVNLFGPYRVTRAFAPLIIESKGRITTTGSISGILSRPLLGPYAMSKHAIEGYTDSLAVEMEKFAVAVSVVEPGNYNSAIGESRMQRSKYNSAGSLFTEEMTARTQGDGSRSQYKEPDEVSAAFMHFLFDDNPQRRYMVVPNENEANITISKALMELVQLNEKQQFTYSRDELVAMLDKALN